MSDFLLRVAINIFWLTLIALGAVVLLSNGKGFPYV